MIEISIKLRAFSVGQTPCSGPSIDYITTVKLKHLGPTSISLVT